MPNRKLWKPGIATLAFTLLSFRNVAWAGDLVAIVDLEFIRATDQPAVIMCYGDEDENCGVWATLNLYRARIHKVIEGTESRESMLVMFGRHALGHEDLPAIIATMNKLEVKEAADPEYQIVSWGDKREMFCLPRREDDTEEFELRKDGEESLTCYDAE
jgi:hypothetical protein